MEITQVCLGVKCSQVQTPAGRTLCVGSVEVTLRQGVVLRAGAWGSGRSPDWWPAFVGLCNVLPRKSVFASSCFYLWRRFLSQLPVSVALLGFACCRSGGDSQNTGVFLLLWKGFAKAIGGGGLCCVVVWCHSQPLPWLTHKHAR